MSRLSQGQGVEESAAVGAAVERTFRIGEVAERTGVTPRTIRYYEELGLLGCDAARSKGSHRLYREADVTRLQELIRLKDLLGLSLEEIIALAEAEEARAGLRGRWAENPPAAERMRIVEAAIPLVQRQLELVRAREQRLAEFAAELSGKLRRLRRHRAELARATDAEERRRARSSRGTAS
jgi:MerR family transcriptional regulator, repressor of the yfmOP operon